MTKEYNFWESKESIIPVEKHCGNCQHGAINNKKLKNMKLNNQNELDGTTSFFSNIGCNLLPKEYIYKDKYVIRYTCSGKCTSTSLLMALKRFNMSRETKKKINQIIDQKQKSV